jgi:hypothetical protein
LTVPTGPAVDLDVDPCRPRRQRQEAEAPEGGSGTIGDDTEKQRQAGSYARDAEQDPRLGREHQAAE